MTHPEWCSPGRCEVGLGGAHSSEPRAVDFDPRGDAVVRVRIWRRPEPVGRAMRPRPPVTLVELVAGSADSGNRCRSDMTLKQARQLNALLTSTLLEAGDTE